MDVPTSLGPKQISVAYWESVAGGLFISRQVRLRCCAALETS